MNIALNMDLDKIREVVHSLDPEEYFKFMSDLHCDYPLKTKSLTERIIKHWKDDQFMKADQFNEIIKVREVEHLQEAREKRQADLRRIQDMKSRTGLDPLQLFPKEIWMMILDELQPKDKLNIREVHQTFRDLTTDDEINGEMLPLILPFKVERFWGHKTELYAILGARNPLRSMAQHVELRQLSKSMRNAIDRWFEQDFMSTLRLENNYKIPYGVIHINLLCSYYYGKYKKIVEGLYDCTTPKPQRLFNHSLGFISPGDFRTPPEQLEDFPQIMDSLLDYFGEQVWYFSFEYHQTSRETRRGRSAPTLQDRYASLVGWLLKMPNLKWLKLTIDQTEKDAKWEMFQIPERLSLPKLSHLERLDIEFKKSNQYLMPIVNGLLSKNSQVKIVNLIGFEFNVNEDEDQEEDDDDSGNGTVIVDHLRAPVASMQALTLDHPSESLLAERKLLNFWHDIEIDDDEQEEEDEKRMNMNQLFAISGTSCNLRRIDLRFNAADPLSIFRALSDFQTLEKVILTIQDVIVRDDFSYLKLPQLKHFELNVKKKGDYAWVEEDIDWNFFFCLQFLVFAKKLKSVIWKCDMMESCWSKLQRELEQGYDNDNEEVGESDMIDFCGAIWDVGESNIWKVFPWLENVKMERIIHKKEKSKQCISKEYRRCELELGVSSSPSPSNQEQE